MLDIHSHIRQLKRPRLLVSAARFGLDTYVRDRDLPRALKQGEAPRPADAVMQLLSQEAQMNEDRLHKRAEYSLAAHIQMLTAIMAEAQVLRDTRPQLRVAT